MSGIVSSEIQTYPKLSDEETRKFAAVSLKFNACVKILGIKGKTADIYDHYRTGALSLGAPSFASPAGMKDSVIHDISDETFQQNVTLVHTLRKQIFTQSQELFQTHQQLRESPDNPEHNELNFLAEYRVYYMDSKEEFFKTIEQVFADFYRSGHRPSFSQQCCHLL